jgi:hypothetical protein
MSDNTYDVNYGAIPPVTVSIDSAQQSKIMADIVTLNSTMSSGLSPTQYTFTTNGTGGTGSYNPFNGYKNGGIVSSGSSGTVVNIDADGLTMKKGADIKIGGKSLCEAIEKIEERLGILKPNPELESRWDQLRELRNQYIEMERDLLEKEKLMKILKET